ncbi:MAG TPA: hypothetical protein VK669_00565, partial [Candidatus Limnocylindrales bacterium]|nr:hypothetical protein [Candidatus Limnocylindrales bacterium]
MGELGESDVGYARRPLPLWLFSAIARALLRTIYRARPESGDTQFIASHFADEIKRNKNAANVVLRQLTTREAYETTIRVAEVLEYAGIIVAR